MTDKRERRAFGAAFKLQVVKMIREQNLSVGQVCKDLNLVNSAVRHWLAQYDEETAGRPGICRTRSGWLYLAVVLDLFSRKVVGWAMAPSMPAQLVCDALHMAIASRHPQPGLLVHSDRGSQYASQLHTGLLERHGLVCSMSRKGNCWDNAVMERFFLNLKMERVWQRDYANHGEAQADIADYIVGFYNLIRLHSTLGYQSPNRYELQQVQVTR